MQVDHDLLNKVLRLTQKEAYVPPGPAGDPAAMGGMPADPMAMMGGAPPAGGAPPMDPSMMGGAPPMDPAMAGGMPPMDPSMMGGAPPMDPSMMDPAMAGGESMQPIILNMQDLQAILQQAGGGGEEGGPEEVKRVTNKVLAERMDGIENMLAAIMNSQGIPMPEAPAMTEEVQAPTEEPAPPPPADMPIAPEDSLMAGIGAPVPGIPKMASVRSDKNQALMDILTSMNSYA